MSVDLGDIPFSGDEYVDNGDDSDDDLKQKLKDTLVTTRQQVIDLCLLNASADCRISRNLIFLKKVANDVFRSDCLPKQYSEEALLYHREVYCEFLAERQEYMIKKLAQKSVLDVSVNPHFGATLSSTYLFQCLRAFITFVSHTYDRERFCWDTFFDETDIQVWDKRLDNFLAYCNNEYVFASEEFALKCSSTVINNRGKKLANQSQMMLMLFGVLPLDVVNLKESFGMRVPKINLVAKKDQSFPLCSYDLDKGLDKLLHDYYDPLCLRGPMKSMGAYFTREENVFYLPIADLARILKLKLAVKIGVRLSSISGADIPEASLKVNDLSVIMTGPLSFKLYVRIKIFKTGEAAQTYVIYSDGTAFDFTLLMVVYLANRDLFTLPLSDCIQQRNFTLKNTNEYLFPVHDSMLRLIPHAAPKSTNGHVIEWFRNILKIPFSHVNASSVRKGYFVTNFCNFIQVAPYSSLSKLFNMVCSRTGWKSRVCWLYGKSPLLDAELLRNIYIHRVKQAKNAGLSKPNAIQFVPTVTTVALPQEEPTEDPRFEEYCRQEIANRNQKKEKYLKYIEYLKSLQVTNFNKITAKTLMDMQTYVKRFSSYKRNFDIKKVCTNRWREKNAVLDNTKVTYDKETIDFRYLDIQAIATDAITSISHVFDESKPDYNSAHLWCTECKLYVDKSMQLDVRCHRIMPNGEKKIGMANVHIKPNTYERCKDKVFDRRYVKLIFKQSADDVLSCGCLRGKCLKFDNEVNSLFNFASLSATARVCLSKEECADKQRFKECVRDIFFGRVRAKLGHVPSCAYEMFDIASTAYFPEMDEDDWTFISSDYYFDRLLR